MADCAEAAPVDEAGAGGGEQQDDAVDAPLVFQCKGCMAIVGDSFSWACSDEAAAPEVSVAEELETSTQQRDLGSTYTALRCSCATTIGRVYKTTARHLDPIRDLMTFDIDRIRSYKLGSGGVAPESALGVPTAQLLQKEMFKVQTLILSLNERIESLEDVQLQPQEQQGRGRGSARGRGKRGRLM